ncbi:MAG: glycosyltransferase [Planctomycetaceae bacterium]|nr:glycosyltransferase [Planctomycetaceae bacterium]
MPVQEIAVIVSSYQRPEHLQRCLWSLGEQQGVAGRMEVVVADDGSTDETLEVVDRCAKSAPFPLSFTTHDHEGFQLARSRNEGVLASSAPYLLFVDCDCLLPPDHVAWHLRSAKLGTVIVGDCLRLDRETSEQIDKDFILAQRYKGLASWKERSRILLKACKDWGYSFLSLSNHPRLTGNNIGIARSDFERVNGFDERFVGWGLEDSDLQRRLALAGLRFRTILHRTVTYHLWHEPVDSFSRNNLNTQNLEYFQQELSSPVCRQGLSSHIPRTVEFEQRQLLKDAA